MNQIRCPYCGRKLAEFNLHGKLLFKTKCQKCGKIVNIMLEYGNKGEKPS